MVSQKKRKGFHDSGGRLELNLTNKNEITNDKGEKMNTYIILERTHKGTWITFNS